MEISNVLSKNYSQTQRKNEIVFAKPMQWEHWDHCLLPNIFLESFSSTTPLTTGSLNESPILPLLLCFLLKRYLSDIWTFLCEKLDSYAIETKNTPSRFGLFTLFVSVSCVYDNVLLSTNPTSFNVEQCQTCNLLF